MEEQTRRIPVLDLMCPPQTDMLRLIRSVVATISHELGFDEDETSQIELAVDEACANAILHGSPNDSTGAEELAIRVQIRPSTDRLSIRVIDSGSGTFATPSGKGVASIEEYTTRDHPSGLGSFIISHFMDEVVYDSETGAGTTLSMVKYLRQRSSA